MFIIVQHSIVRWSLWEGNDLTFRLRGLVLLSWMKDGLWSAFPNRPPHAATKCLPGKWCRLKSRRARPINNWEDNHQSSKWKPGEHQCWGPQNQEREFNRPKSKSFDSSNRGWKFYMKTHRNAISSNQLLWSFQLFRNDKLFRKQNCIKVQFP